MDEGSGQIHSADARPAWGGNGKKKGEEEEAQGEADGGPRLSVRQGERKEMGRGGEKKWAKREESA